MCAEMAQRTIGHKADGLKHWMLPEDGRDTHGNWKNYQNQLIISLI
jgi:hypothetical protein